MSEAQFPDGPREPAYERVLQVARECNLLFTKVTWEYPSGATRFGSYGGDVPPDIVRFGRLMYEMGKEARSRPEGR